MRPGYDHRLANEDLAPLRKQKWSAYNIFAFWMSDVHSVGGYVTAGSLFALGIASWQVLIALVVGIVIVQCFANLVAKPSQRTGVPYPVVNRFIFGVKGANIPAVIRGVIAIAWYGVQTFLTAESLNIVILKFIPGSAALVEPSFLGLNALGWISYAILWVAQAAVFWNGMEAIRRFIDWAGPAVYVVMIILAIYLVSQAGWENISFSLSSGEPLGFVESLPVMLTAIAIVVSYFSGPMLNFGDFARYGKSFTAVKRGNFWGLPINFLFFSILTVLTASATVPVFGELITDPIHTVERIDHWFAILLGGLTFVTATVGINIVANFISPAFDFSNVAPHRISWRAGGMIAAVGSVILTPGAHLRHRHHALANARPGRGPCAPSRLRARLCVGVRHGHPRARARTRGSRGDRAHRRMVRARGSGGRGGCRGARLRRDGRPVPRAVGARRGARRRRRRRRCRPRAGHGPHGCRHEQARRVRAAAAALAGTPRRGRRHIGDTRAR